MPDPREVITNKFLSEIREFVDGVQLVMTWTETDGETQTLADGTGNYYSRIGAVEDWLCKEKCSRDVDMMLETDDDEDDGDN